MILGECNFEAKNFLSQSFASPKATKLSGEHLIPVLPYLQICRTVGKIAVLQYKVASSCLAQGKPEPNITAMATSQT